MIDPKLNAKRVEHDMAREPVADVITALRSYVAEAKCCPQPKRRVTRRRHTMDVNVARRRVNALLAS